MAGEPGWDYWAEGAKDGSERLRGADFDTLWNLDLPLVEEENRERGGRSGAFLLALGAGRRGFLKRQEGHLTRLLRRPLVRVPTFEREFRALECLRAQGFRVPRLLYFGRRGDRAMLLTEELAARGDLGAACCGLDLTTRRGIIEEVARELARFHALGLRHGALYPKHLLVLPGERPAIGFIDLEKCRGRFPFERAARHDLDALNRRSAGFGLADRLRFLETYCGGDRRKLRRLWRDLAHRARERGMKRPG